jgi:type VI secretion system protein ImpC
MNMPEMEKAAEAAAPAAVADDDRASLLAQLKEKIDVGTDFKERDKNEQQGVLDSIASLMGFLKSSGTARMVAEDSLSTIRTAQQQIDEIISAQVNAILHAPEFQQLEGTWRGLKYLVDKSPELDNLKILVLDASKQEVQQSFKIASGENIVHNPLFAKFYSQALDTYGANPYGCIVADYQFDHSGPDVDTLKGLAQIGAASLAPVITAASPKLLNIGSWSDAANLKEYTARMTDDRHMEWQDLRKQEDARYLGVTLGRFLARRPYGQKGDPVHGFNFEEEIAGPGAENFVWCNTAHAMAVNVCKSFRDSGWAASIIGPESGGTVESLPTFKFEAPGVPGENVCPTEVSLTTTQERMLCDEGLIPLVYKVGENQGCFFGAPSVQKPQSYRDADANQSAQLSMELPYIFAVSRFAQAVKKMALHYVGSAKTAPEIKRDLEKYFNDYVTQNPAVATEADKAKRPLASFAVDCDPDPRSPGYFNLKIRMQPLVKLKGMSARLELVSRIAKKA